jgi:hypothetical protein
MGFDWFKRRVTAVIAKVTQPAPPTYADVEHENALQSIRTQYGSLRVPTYEQLMNFDYRLDHCTPSRYVDKVLVRRSECMILAAKLTTLRAECVLLKRTTRESESLEKQICKDIDMVVKVAKELESEMEAVKSPL